MADETAQGFATAAALTNQERKKRAFNALAKVYGDAYSDPTSAALALQAQAQPSEIAERQALTDKAVAETAEVAPNALSTRNVQSAQAGNYLADTGKTNAEAAQVAPNAESARALQGAQADYAGANAAKTTAETSEVAADAAAERRLKGAQTTLATAEARQAGANTAKLNQATSEAASLQSAQDGLALVQTLQDIRKNAEGSPGVGVLADSNPGGQAVATYLRSLGPQKLHALGVDPAHVEPLLQTLSQDPSQLDAIQSSLQAKVTGATGGGFTAVGLDTAAQKYLFDGTLPPVGNGKQGAAARTAVVNRAAQIAKDQNIDTASLPAQWQTNKAGQKFSNELADTGPTKVGGKIVSINAISDHVDLLEQYINALRNKDVRAANAVQQLYRTQTGSVIPTNFAAQKKLVAGELTRYYTYRGSVELQREFEKDLTDAGSPKQLLGIVDTYRKDAGAQLAGYRQQAEAYGKTAQFDAQLRPAAKRLLDSAPGSKGADADAALLAKYGLK